MTNNKDEKIKVYEQNISDVRNSENPKMSYAGSLTGYASIDKPWRNNFCKNALNFQVPKQSIYDYMFKKAVKMKNATAIEYFSKKISYDEVLDKIEETSKAFKQYGIKEGDIVMALLPSIPESVYTIYALNKIGAIINPIDPRTKEEKLNKYVSEIHPKMIISLDMCIDNVCKVSRENNVDNIVSVSALESLPNVIKKLNKIVEIFKRKGNNFKSCDNDFIEWPDFIKNGKNYAGSTSCKYKENTLAAIIYTGGTTGTKKGVELSNENINSMVQQHASSGIPFEEGQRFLDFLPPFIAYGLVMAIHMPMSFGFTTNMVPIFEPKDFPKLILKNKPAYVFASPVHYESLLKYKGNKDLSFLTVPVSGGDSMTAEFEKQVDEELSKDNCPAKLGQGLGMTEAGGTISVPIPGKIKIGSVGTPFPNTIVSIFDPISQKELKYFEKGEICFTGPSLMKQYYNNPEETQKVLKKHEDGLVWLHTGDIGYIDDEGYLFHVDRIKRIINRGGLKVYPSEVEKIIKKDDNVSSCIVIGLSNEKERHVPIAHVVLKDDSIKMKTEENILINCDKVLDSESIPYGIKVRESIPYTLNGKVDYKALEDEGYDGIDYSSEIILNKTKSEEKEKIKTRK
jgi:long-chain acyl-CoA synthetase